MSGKMTKILFSRTPLPGFLDFNLKNTSTYNKQEYGENNKLEHCRNSRGN